MDFGHYIIDVLAQFGGGSGEKSNDFARFGLGIIFFGTLLVASLNKRRRSPSQRESLLVLGFGFGLARELLMFTVKSLQIYGVVDAATLELSFRRSNTHCC